MHWYGHSDMQYESPFSYIQDILWQDSVRFYQQQRPIFQHNMFLFAKFLQEDLKYRSHLLL